MESAELKNQRLKEVFQTKIQEFRKACYALTGYQVDITTEGQFRLTSMYAERKADCLVFKVGPHEGVGSRGEGTAELSRDPCGERPPQAPSCPPLLASAPPLGAARRGLRCQQCQG